MTLIDSHTGPRPPVLSLGSQLGFSLLQNIVKKWLRRLHTVFPGLSDNRQGGLSLA